MRFKATQLFQECCQAYLQLPKHSVVSCSEASVNGCTPSTWRCNCSKVSPGNKTVNCGFDCAEGGHKKSTASQISQSVDCPDANHSLLQWQQLLHKNDLGTWFNRWSSRFSRVHSDSCCPWEDLLHCEMFKCLVY